MSIGQTLQAAREQAGLTLEQVSSSTRIRASIVQAVEGDDFSKCGGDFYARGHIRAIAHAVGADAEELVADYDRTHVDHAPRAAEVFEKEAHEQPESRRRPSWAAAAVVVLVLVCVYGVVQLFSGGDSRSTRTVSDGLGATPSAPASSGASRQPSDRPTSAPASPQPTVVAQAPREGVAVGVTAVRGASWLRATTGSGKVLFEGLLRKGDTRELTDKSQVKLVIGNAGSVDVTVNGKQIGSPGKNGDVVHVAFGPDDPAAG